VALFFKKVKYMRWKIKSVETTEDKSAGTRTTVKTQQLVVTVGEAIGVAKTASGAVQAAAKSLTTLSKANPKAGLSPLAASASILSTLVQELEVYKKVMGAIEKVTPVVQIVARASGLWTSPGNAGDISQIILGQVQKVLMAIVLSSINILKDMIWNYEFVIKEINPEFTESINKNLENLNKQLSGQVLQECLDKIVGDSNTSTNADGFINGISDGEMSLGDVFNDTDWFSEAYKTQYETSQNTVRMLRGSYINTGIEYSDDGGKTWNQTNQETGSWYHFAKIKVNNQWRYVAASRDYIKTLQDAQEFSANTNYYYNDGVGIKEMTKYQKEIEEYPPKVKDDYIPSLGIYYSDDNGISWISSTVTTDNINCLCEFEEKSGDPDNYVPSIAAASDDFNGCYYTTDGANWTQTFQDEKWLNINAYDDIWIRINNLNSEFNINVQTMGIRKGQEISGGVIASFETNMSGLVVEDPIPEFTAWAKRVQAFIETYLQDHSDPPDYATIVEECGPNPLEP